MKYKVMRDCHGYKGKYWKQDDIVEFDADDTPPRHFLPLDGSPKAKEVLRKDEEEKMALSQLAHKSIKPQPTAAKVLRNQKKSSGVGEDF
jgi:hypothetical protein